MTQQSNQQQKPQELLKKTIFLTGASKGIGRAIAAALPHCNLALTARSQEGLEETARLAALPPENCLILPLDITDEEAVRAAVEQTEAKFGRIDVLINNAGIGTFKRVDNFTSQEFFHIYNVNMMGTFHATKYITPGMVERKEGQIINIASVAGLNGFKGGTAYASSKFAMVGFSESLREDLKEYGIAVTALCPGAVHTEFGGKDLNIKSEQEYLLTPEDVARSVRYLVEESETANAKLIELKPRRKKEFRGC